MDMEQAAKVIENSETVSHGDINWDWAIERPAHQNFTDKLIGQETAGRIRRMIEITQVAQIFEEEKQQALRQATQIFGEERQQAAQFYEEEKQEAIQNISKQIVIRMINKEYSSEEIVSLVPNYSQNDVDNLRKELIEGKGRKK